METKTRFGANLNVLNVSQIAKMVWEDGLPFLTPRAVDYIDRAVSSSSHVFEWGAGGSTLWFAGRAADVVSIEHQAAWHERIAERLEKEGIGNVDLRFIPHKPYKPYVDAILDFPSEHFSLVLVDGRERVRCIQKAMTKVKLGGFLVLDNSERSRYAMAIDWLANWERLNFPDRWVTTVFVKPEN